MLNILFKRWRVVRPIGVLKDSGLTLVSFISKVRQITRAVFIILVIFIGLILTLFFSSLRLKSNHPIYKLITRWWLSKVCSIIGLNIKIFGATNRSSQSNSIMYVCNHISWLDIPLLGSIINPRFLSKQSVRQWPIIGWLAEKSGTLFITRGGEKLVVQKDKTTQSIKPAQEITDCLKKNESVLIFPEGTTTDGSNVRRFHSRLFSSAIETKALIQPIAIRYLTEADTYSTSIPFLGEQTFIDNLWKLLSNKMTHAEVYFLEPIESKNKFRNELARHCENTIRNELLNHFLNR